MTSLAPPLDELADLLEASCLNELTPDQEKRLHELVCGDCDCRAHYVLFMHMHAMIERREGHAGSHTAETLDSSPDRRTEATVPSPTPLLAISAPPAAFIGSYFSSGWPVAYLIATAIFGIGLIVGALVHVSQPVGVVQHPNSSKDSNPQSPIPEPLSKASVARITGMVDCVWEGSGNASLPSTFGRGAGGEGGLHSGAVAKSLLHLGDTLALRSGLLELTYDTGARVILQGPVTYEVDSAAGGRLSLGKLTARLDSHSEISNLKSQISNQKSKIRNHQFVVRTPTAVVTDLGTEFGVKVDQSGRTTSHVFRGLVRVQVVGGGGQPEGEGRLLHENESARVESRGAPQGENRVIVVGPSVKPADFVREIPQNSPGPRIKTFDLVDVVAGGDGYSGKRNAGIDPSNGRRSHTLEFGENPGKKPYYMQPSDGVYHRVEELPFVDGVFIPDGRYGPVRLDSAGHTWATCPQTGNETAARVWAGGTIPSARVAISTVLGDVDYALEGHGLLFTHANVGITFDLNAIRKANPGWTVRRFLSVVGVVEEIGVADYWVLVDGEVRDRRFQINSRSGRLVVATPITPQDAFLTLVATDGGKGLNWNCLVFGDPRLELIEDYDEPRAAFSQTTGKGGQ